MGFLRGAWVIARRDFSATVLSKTFIFFLLAPLFPLLMGTVFGGIGARVARQNARPVVAVIAPDVEFQRLMAARDQVTEAIGDSSLVKIVGYEPERDMNAQERRLLENRNEPIRAILSGDLDHPHLTGALAGDPFIVNQLKLLIATAKLGDVRETPDLAITNVQASWNSLESDRVTTAWISQGGLFVLTLMLSTMVLSQLIEEKSNKVIEVIAAAVRIDAMFVGKLFAMLTASIVALIVWVSAAAFLVQMVKHGGVAALPPPAVGWPTFLTLMIFYFGMNYLLFGAVFLTIGAQASTAREVQTMSLPVTFGQALVFGFASTAIGNPESAEGLAAAIFPLSSPMAMIAHAAELPEIWPHLVAILWQAFCIALILRFGARLFRKTVLKSGPTLPWWRFGRI